MSAKILWIIPKIRIFQRGYLSSHKLEDRTSNASRRSTSYIKDDLAASVTMLLEFLGLPRLLHGEHLSHVRLDLTTVQQPGNYFQEASRRLRLHKRCANT